MKVLRRVILPVITVAVAALLMLSVYVLWDNRRVVNTEYIFKSERVPMVFDGFKIALITDFHNSADYERVLDAVRDSSPDIICIAGDLVSMKTTDYSNTKRLINQLTRIADVYYAYGNHEYFNATYRNSEKPPIKEILKGSDVIFLNNEVKSIEKDGKKIYLAGYADSVHGDGDGAFWEHAEPVLKGMNKHMNTEMLSVLLLHRAQYFDEVSQLPFDLVLGGHLHGGQVNIEPFKTMILEKHVKTAKYSRGEYFENGHELIISGGCGNDGIPRVFNTPEVVTVTLKHEAKDE